MPTRAIRRQRGLSTCSLPAIVKYVRFERVGRRAGITRAPRFGSPLCGLFGNLYSILAARGGFDDHAITGYAVRTASALEESGVYDRSGAFPGFGRGREHGDFWHRERGVVAFASVFPSGASGGR